MSIYIVLVVSYVFLASVEIDPESYFLSPINIEHLNFTDSDEGEISSYWEEEIAGALPVYNGTCLRRV